MSESFSKFFKSTLLIYIFGGMHLATIAQATEANEIALASKVVENDRSYVAIMPEKNKTKEEVLTTCTLYGTDEELIPLVGLLMWDEFAKTGLKFDKKFNNAARNLQELLQIFSKDECDLAFLNARDANSVVEIFKKKHVAYEISGAIDKEILIDSFIKSIGLKNREEFELLKDGPKEATNEQIRNLIGNGINNGAVYAAISQEMIASGYAKKNEVTAASMLQYLEDKNIAKLTKKTPMRIKAEREEKQAIEKKREILAKEKEVKKQAQELAERRKRMSYVMLLKCRDEYNTGADIAYARIFVDTLISSPYAAASLMAPGSNMYKNCENKLALLKYTDQIGKTLNSEYSTLYRSVGNVEYYLVQVFGETTVFKAELK